MIKRSDTKVLLTQRNSAWGVIVNPVAQNVYQHALTWDSETVKDEFINQYLFPDLDVDWKVALENRPERATTIISDTVCRFKVDVKDYPNETSISLLNKDMAVVKQGNDYLWYALRSELQQNGNIIEYTGELDVFFTYNALDMLDDKPVQMFRGHYDRFIKSNNNIVPNISYENPSTSIESLAVSEANYIPKKKYELNVNYDNRIKSGLDKNRINKILNSNKTLILFVSVKTDEFDIDIDEAKIKFTFTKDNYWNNKGANIGDVGLNYYAIMIPPFISSSDNEITWDNVYKDSYARRKILSALQNSSYVIVGATILDFVPTISAGIPLWYISNYYDNSDWTSIKYDLDSKGELPYVIVKYSSSEYNGTWYLPIITDLGSARTTLSNIKLLEIKPDLDINNKFDWRNEVKIYSSLYNKYRLIGITNTYFDILLDYMKDDYTISLIRQNYLHPTLWTETTIPIAEGSKIYNYDFDYELYHYQISSLNFPQNIDAWQDYYSRNKAKFETDLAINEREKDTAKGLGALNIIQGIGKAFTGDIGGATSSITSGALSVARAEDKINQQLAMQTDLKNSPNKFTGGGSDINNIYLRRQLVSFYNITLSDYLLEQISQYFYMYGYNLSGKLYNPNEFLNSRYYFNYIQTGSVFENFKPQYSTGIKQLADNSFQNGLTFHHIRDMNTFKGIKNYTVNNVEMNLLNA